MDYWVTPINIGIIGALLSLLWLSKNKGSAVIVAAYLVLSNAMAPLCDALFSSPMETYFTLNGMLSALLVGISLRSGRSIVASIILMLFVFNLWCFIFATRLNNVAYYGIGYPLEIALFVSGMIRRARYSDFDFLRNMGRLDHLHLPPGKARH